MGRTQEEPQRAQEAKVIVQPDPVDGTQLYGAPGRHLRDQEGEPSPQSLTGVSREKEEQSRWSGLGLL